MSGEKEEIWVTGVVLAIKPPMLKSEKLAKEMLRNQSSRARVLLCVYTSLSDFMAYIRVHRCLLLVIGGALMVILFSPGNASVGC